MARQEKQSQRNKTEYDAYQRNQRRNQTILIVLSGMIIVSMVLSLLINL